MIDYSRVFSDEMYQRDAFVRQLYVSDRGFTQFQFSSRRMQMNTTRLGGLIPNNPISTLLTETNSWYKMWINPQKVSLRRSYIHNRVNTVSSVVTYHYRPDVYVMEVAGVCGWLGFGPSREEEIRFAQYRQRGRDVNSPRIFLARLRDLANEPMYFVDVGGVEHYNTKYIKMFTKQHPDGIICEGYFVDFSIPESGEDAQTIEYGFSFIVESMKTISELQRVAGMFKSWAKNQWKENKFGLSAVGDLSKKVGRKAKGSFGGGYSVESSYGAPF